MLFGIFPGTIDVNRSRSFISFTVTEMPEEPWPFTVGELPITIKTATEGRGSLFPIRSLTLGNEDISICQHLDARNGNISDNDLRSVAAELLR